MGRIRRGVGLIPVPLTYTTLSCTLKGEGGGYIIWEFSLSFIAYNFFYTSPIFVIFMSYSIGQLPILIYMRDK